jgi:hypothetical protein
VDVAEPGHLKGLCRRSAEAGVPYSLVGLAEGVPVSPAARALGRCLKSQYFNITTRDSMLTFDGVEVDKAWCGDATRLRSD